MSVFHFVGHDASKMIDGVYRTGSALPITVEPAEDGSILVTFNPPGRTVVRVSIDRYQAAALLAFISDTTGAPIPGAFPDILKDA
jgi:hypothetical protein